MAEAALVYLPIDRRHALARGETLPAVAQGSTLFADISGFTALTELLARELGPRRGAEELTLYLNRVYDALITHVHQYGGSVTGFAGDSMTCWFAGDDGRRAVAGGLAMQQTMAGFTNLAAVGGETISLAAKVAIAAGRVRRFVVGDPEYLLVDVLAGATVERLTGAEQKARTGEIVICGDTAAALGPLLSIGEWREGDAGASGFAVVAGLHESPTGAPWSPLPPGSLSRSQVRPWLLRPVFQQLESGQGEYLAELRPAAILFLRFEGIDFQGEPAAGEQLDAFVREVQKVLHRYEGSLLQLTIGDKGSYLYAAFGAPVAHEDDVDRALAAALTLQPLTAHFPFLRPLQIGITHGRTRVGAYGGTQRRTYGVQGDSVNLAARLMMAARPGQILVSDEARQRSGAAFVWETLPPIKVKGKRDPIQLHALLSARRRRAGPRLDEAYQKPPVGQAQTQARLEQALAAVVASGRGQLLRLSGDPGLGKSHLAAYLAQQAAGQGIQVAVGEAQSVSRNMPYLPWRQIFSVLLGLEERDGPEAAAWLQNYLEAEHPRSRLRLPLLGDLLELPIPDNPATAALNSDVRQEALFSLLAEIVVATGRRRPVLIVVDNVHWLDEASAGLTNVLARRTLRAAPVLLLLTEQTPSAGLPRLLPELDGLPYATTVSLGELSEASLTALLTQQLGAPPSVLLVSLIHQVARGNPFFAGELLAALREGRQVVLDPSGRWLVSAELLGRLQRANLLQQSAGEWRLRPGVDLSSVSLGLPDSIHGLILSRLDRLPDAAKLTLKVCSVVGHPVDLALVAGAYPGGKELAAIRQEASELAAQAMLRVEDEARDLYAFRHQTTQGVIYETLLYHQRRQLHRAVAETLAAREPEASAAIAHHAFLGEAWPLALRHNLLAGEQAKQLHANQQGADLLQKALHSSQQLPEAETAAQRKRLHLALGELSVLAGRHEDADQHLQAALALARDQEDWEAEARVFRWQARSHEQRGDYPAALSWVEQGLERLAGQLSAEAAELDLIAGLIYARQGQFDAARARCSHSLEVAERLDDTAIRARTYNLMGIIELRGQAASAVARFQQSLEQYEALRDIYGQAASHNLIANGYFAQGAWSDADRHYRQALDFFTQLGTVYSQVLVNNNLGGIALKQGRLQDALGYYRHALALLEQSGGSLWVLGALHLNTGHAYLELGELDEAGAQLQRARDLLEQIQARDLLPELLRLFAELALHRGELDEAEQFCRQSLNLAREIGMPREEGPTLRLRGEIALAREAYGQAERYLLESCRLTHEVGDEYENARSRLALAALYVAARRAADVHPQLDEAGAIFARLEASGDMEKVALLRQRLHELERSP